MTSPHRLDALYATVGAFFEVCNRLGYGFLEVHYATALERELKKAGLSVSREHAAHVWYKDEPIGSHRLDMVVNDTVVVEIKATRIVPLYARQQLRNYLRATSLDVGVLLHFGPTPRFHKMFNRGGGTHVACASNQTRKG